MKKNTNTDLFYESILKLKSKEECRILFEDIFTLNEIGLISQRLYIAKLLLEKHVYNDIVNMTGASTATISRISRSLQSGSGGYNIVFKPSETEDE